MLVCFYARHSRIRLCHEKTNIYQGYLFAYFEGTGPKEKQEQLRFAYSSDARNWYALNNNRPVLRSKDISQTGGIRDPHILRRTDGNGFTWWRQTCLS